MRNPVAALREMFTGTYRCEWCRQVVDLDAPEVIEEGGTVHCSQAHLEKTLANARR